MNEIRLTLNDADFVANLARNEIGKAVEAYEVADKKYKNMMELSDSLNDLLGSDIPDNMRADKQKLEEEYINSHDKLEKLYQEIIYNWNKVIELMTCGSK